MSRAPGTAVPGTAAGVARGHTGAYGRGTATALGGAYGSSRGVPEGAYTATVYGLMQEEKFEAAADLLSIELQNFPRSRAALSLIGWCYWGMQDFRSAALTYEQLVRLYPSVEEYKLYFAQALFKAGLYDDAARAVMRVDNTAYASELLMLQAAIAYEQDELAAAETLLDQAGDEGGSVADELDVQVNAACVAYKHGKFEQARAGFEAALSAGGYAADLAYNIALSYYGQAQYRSALQYIGDIIERGVREHPELSVGSNTDGVEVRSVGNTAILRETALVEAFNLKAAVEYMLGNFVEAREALSDMPPRREDELDPVTLHNLGLTAADKDPAAAFRKLNFLVANPPFPPEAFANLLLLYVQHGYVDLAADVLAENAHLTFQYLEPETYDLLDAILMSTTAPEEAWRKFDALSAGHIENLRRHTKAIQDARLQKNREAIRAALTDYDGALDAYIPVLMWHAKMFWDRKNYPGVQKLLTQNSEFCSDHPTWGLNVAHTCFMQEDKYEDAIRFYEPILKNTESLLDVTAIVLANLCVSYIMSSANDKAEDVMRLLEQEEEAALQAAEQAGQDLTEVPGRFHLCIVNLVIGTLYCAKGNYEFGVSRVMKSLEPYDQKLGSDTWFYAKRCFLGLADTLAKHMMTMRDETWEEIYNFLDAADSVGRGIPSQLGATEEDIDIAVHNVSTEARALKRIFLKLRD